MKYKQPRSAAMFFITRSIFVGQGGEARPLGSPGCATEGVVRDESNSKICWEISVKYD